MQLLAKICGGRMRLLALLCCGLALRHVLIAVGTQSSCSRLPHVAAGLATSCSRAASSQVCLSEMRGTQAQEHCTLQQLAAYLADEMKLPRLQQGSSLSGMMQATATAAAVSLCRWSPLAAGWALNFHK